MHGNLEEDLFLTIPEGNREFLDEIDEDLVGDYLRLNKSIYGLVQAARAWWKQFMKTLKEDLGFVEYENDSCLLKRKTEKGLTILIMYVDDCFVIGDKDAVKEALNDIEKHYEIKRSEEVEDFIGCNIKRKQDKVYLSQPDLIGKVLESFKDKIKHLKDFATPAVGGIHVLRPTSDEEKLNEQEQSEYRSGVGSLLYLLKHSRPDLSNCVRELTKVMDGANKAHQKMLYRAIKFVEQTRGRALVLKPAINFKWDMKAYSDSDFAGDADTRRSVSGFVIYLNECPVSWQSRGQKSVSLSSTEAEYVAISEVATEILFVAGVLKFLEVEVKKPIEVFVDNIGAIYLSKSAATGSRTKHVDTRYHFVREYIEKGELQIVFVQSKNNVADIMTKNLGKELYEKHTSYLFGKISD